MYQHSKSITASENSYLNSHSFTISERPHRSSSFFNNMPSCHIQDYIQTDLSFRPEIHQLPQDVYPDRTRIEISKQERFQRLIDNKIERQETLYQAKLLKEQNQFEKHCTFQPNPDKQLDYDQEVFGRLYEEGLQKQKQKQRIVPSISNECTFQPTTNRSNILNSEKTNLQPIYMRFKQEIKKKLERKAQLKKKVQQENDQKLIKFQINGQSQRIIQQKQNFNRNVVDRLLSYMKEAEYKNKVRVQQKQNKLKQLTFIPQINPVTVDLPGQNFLERQQILAEETKQKISMKQNQIIKNECPFKPKVSIISDYLINIKRADEAKQDKIERMFYEYPQIKQDNLQRIQEELYKECTFHPEINPISRQLQASHINHCCGRPHQKQYPHKPKLNEKSLKMASKKRTNSAAIENKTDKIKMQLQYKQMKQCTFKPKTLSGIVKSETNVNKINGFNNFMRVKQMKLKQEQQQKLVEQKLFRMEKKYDRRINKETKVDEFRLSKTNKDVNNIFEEDLKRFQQNCPFKPNTDRERRSTQKVFH